MRMYDIIAKKRDKNQLSDEEISYFIREYVGGNIPDYQVSALLMAIFLNGMTEHETAYLTACMAESGDMVDLSGIDGIKVDKHSTGGVGDKTTLILASIVASLGVKVAKMSGRGLGHTGGTIDKMESIPGLKTELSQEKFFEIVNRVGACVIGQTGNLVPADKKLYALRDVTATIESIPLIAASIMSKKIAAGSDCILLDVKVGSGAFMKTLDEAVALAKAMVDIGERVGRRTIAMITDMDRPLGAAIGNSLEIMEVVNTLKGQGPKDLTKVCIALAANMLYLADHGTLETCTQLAEQALQNQTAYRKLKEIIEAQGGDPHIADDFSLFKQPAVSYTVKAESEGYITSMNTEKCGIASVILGAGRERKEDDIDYSAGIVLQVSVGDYVEKGQPIATLYSDSADKCKEAEKLLKDTICITGQKPKELPHIFARVTAQGIEYLQP